jgi:hypothetical protein
LDVPRLLGVIPQDAPKLADGVFHRAHFPLSAPYLVQKLGLRDDPLPVLNQVFEAGEWLRGELNPLGPPM